MRRTFLTAVLALGLLAGPAAAQELRADQTAFRAIYEELVEIDTSASTGSCTRAAAAMAARLTAAGYSQRDVQVIVPEGSPDDGNVVAVLRGRNARALALLLLAHIDVVDARREDWARDPYTLIEESGFFYGRGTADDKAMAAVFVDLMVRLRAEGYRPRQDIKMALTCGEETSDAVNGVRYLIEHHRNWVQAGIAINEGAGGRLDEAGNRIALEVQAGEKVHQVFTVEATNPGGHSSRPRPDNAIYQLTAAMQRLAGHNFPVALNDTTRAFFRQMSGIVGGEMGAAMARVAQDPGDASALAIVTAEPGYNAMLRTTCVATRLDAGHAANALPQRARATLSCRILPGQSIESVQAELARVFADPALTITLSNDRQPTPPAPPLTRQLLGPIEQVSARLWPGVPLVPVMAVGATDARFLNAAGIATYGMSGMFSAPGESNAHGLDEKLRVRSLYEGRDFLEGVVRAYSR